MSSPASPVPSFTPVQEQVLAAIAAGVSISDGAAKAGVHRNSAGYWRRTNTKFKIASNTLTMTLPCWSMKRP
jgi:hypothetical protein